MIVTDRFVFLHLHKSGGSFVNECIRRYVPGARELGYHLPRSRIPGDCAGSSRSSAWCAIRGATTSPGTASSGRGPRPNALFRAVSDEGRLDFNGTINNLLDLAVNDALLSRLVAGLPGDYGTRGLNLPGFALAPIGGSGLGFYAYLYQYLYTGDGGTLHIGRMEDLPQELPRVFAATGQPVSEDVRTLPAQCPADEPLAARALWQLLRPRPQGAGGGTGCPGDRPARLRLRRLTRCSA